MDDPRPRKLYQFTKANQREIFHVLPRGGFTDRQARMLGWDNSVELGNFLIKLNNRDPEAIWLARALEGDERETINQITAKVDAGERVPIPQLTHTSLKRVNTVNRARTLRDHLRLVSEHHLPYGNATWKGTLKFTIRAKSKSGYVKDMPQEVQQEVGFASHEEELRAKAEEVRDILQHDSDFDAVEILQDLMQFEGLDTTTRRRVPLRNIMMREAFVLSIDGLVNNSTWDSQKGMCTYDAMHNIYGGIKGLIKPLKSPEIYFNVINRIYNERHFRDDLSPAPPGDEVIPNYNSAVHGVCAEDLCTLCKDLGISFIAQDANGHNVLTWIPSREERSKGPTLMFRIQANHMHIDAKHAKSVAHALAANSHLAPKKPKNEVKAVDIEPEEYIVLGPEKTGINHLREHMTLTGKLPTDMRIHHGDVVGWTSDHKHCMWDHNGGLEAAKQVLQNRGRPWKGETVTAILAELITEVFGGCGLPKCQPTPAVRALMTAPDIKNKAPYGLTRAGLNNRFDGSTGYDIDSCHADLLGHPPECWCFPGPHDLITPVPQEEQATFMPPGPGMYLCHVHEQDHALLRQGIELCFKPVVSKARSLGLRFDILLYVPCSITLPTDTFVPLLERIVEVCNGQKNLYKKLIVTLSGILGKTTAERYFNYIERDMDAVHNHFLEKVAKGHEVLPAFSLADRTTYHAPDVDPLGVPVAPQPLCNDYWLYRSKVTTELVEVSVPIYLQVLDAQRLAVFEMEQRQGGTPLLRKTDCTIFAGGHMPANPPRPRCMHPNAQVRAAIQKWGKYRPASCPKVTSAIKPSTVAMPMSPSGWVHHEQIIDSNQVDEVMDLLATHRGLLLEGVMGGCKSWLTMKVVNRYINDGKKVLVMSLSNMAADNIGGKTIHRGLGLARQEDDTNTFYSHSWLESLGQYDLLVNDEVGLNPSHIWSKLAAVVQFHPHMHGLLVGDRHQCSYVEPGVSQQHTRRFSHYFDHHTVQFIAREQYVCLTVRHRSKCPRLDAALDHIKAGGDLPADMPVAKRFTKLNLSQQQDKGVC